MYINTYTSDRLRRPASPYTTFTMDHTEELNNAVLRLSSERSYKGRIELILGPMFSGKSSEIIRLIRRYKAAGSNCVIIKYDKDTRYSNDKFSTHDLQQHDAISCNCKLMDVYSEMKDYDVVGIDEGQFFEDIREFAEELAANGVVVFVSALDGKFTREKFGNILDLVPCAEAITKLSAICVCGNNAAFTAKIAGDLEHSDEPDIGGAEKYIPLCRACYFNR